MDLTLLEVHLDDACFTANAPLSGDSAAESPEDAMEDDGGGPPLVPFLIGLVGLAALAYLVRRWQSGGSIEGHIDAAVPDVEAPTP